MRRSGIIVRALAGAALLIAGNALATPRMDVPPPEPETPEGREAARVKAAADIAAWLPRMVGRFNYEGVVQYFQSLSAGGQVQREFPDEEKVYADGTCDETCISNPPNLKTAKGKGDCIAIGKGPGVQCVIHVVWDEEWATNGLAVEGGVSFLGPASILYGLDPNTTSIRYLLLTTNGIAEAESGVLKGDTLSWTFNTRCESSTMDRCRQVTRIRVPADGARAQTTIDFEQWDARHGAWQRVTSFNLDMRRVPRDEAAEPTRLKKR